MATFVEYVTREEFSNFSRQVGDEFRNTAHAIITAIDARFESLRAEMHDGFREIKHEQKELQDGFRKMQLEQQGLQDGFRKMQLEQQGLQDGFRKMQLEQQGLHDSIHEVNQEQKELQDGFRKMQLEQHDGFLKLQLEQKVSEGEIHLLLANREIEAEKRHLEQIKWLTEMSSIVADTKANQLNMDARFANSSLRSLYSPIRTVTVRNSDGEWIKPSQHFFPQSSDEFYALCSPTSEEQLEQLDQLAAFYKYPGNQRRNPRNVITYLENALGLSRRNFKYFRNPPWSPYRSPRWGVRWKSGPKFSPPRPLRLRGQIRKESPRSQKLVTRQMSSSLSDLGRLEWNAQISPQSRKQFYGLTTDDETQDAQKSPDDDMKTNPNTLMEVHDDDAQKSSDEYMKTNPNTPRDVVHQDASDTMAE